MVGTAGPRDRDELWKPWELAGLLERDTELASSGLTLVDDDWEVPHLACQQHCFGFVREVVFKCQSFERRL
jgi:hypothetical protein